ncbi:hypothetical protein ACEQ8H_000334 [Pleosporales sp. CAS-2024a]
MGPELLKAGRLRPSTSTASHTAWNCSTRFRRVGALLLCLGAYVFCNSMQPTHPRLSQNSNTLFIPFIYKFSSDHVPLVRCTIEGVDIEMPVDTGSCGCLVGAPKLPNLGLDVGDPAHHFFTSSKILYVGRLVTLPVHFHGEARALATANIPVLVVDKSWKCPWYRPGQDSFDCPPGPNGESAAERDTAKITYMGVGFGRNYPRDGMPIAAPRTNAFLNIAVIDGLLTASKTMRYGYIVTTQGVHVGLTSKNTQGFVFQTLAPGLTHDKDPRDWAMAQMCFSVNGKGANCGQLLVDTGIAQSYIKSERIIPNITIRNPDKDGYAKMVTRVKPGTNLTFALPFFEDEATSFSFTVGGGSVIEPNFVVPGVATSTPFVNTGRNLLRGYSIAFDAVEGRFGLRPVHANSSAL